MTTVKDTIQQITRLEGDRQYAAALELANKSMRSFQGAPPIALKLAQLFETTKQYEKALNLYKRLTDDKREEDGTTPLPLALGLVRCLVRLNRYEQAQEILAPVLAAAPRDFDGQTSHAAILRHKGALDKAEEAAKKALAAAPDYKPATHELAQILIDKKDMDAAIPLLEKNVCRNEPYGDSIDLWLNTLEKTDRNRYAQDKLEELVRKYPDVIEFVFGFAVLANRAGEITLARPAYEKALALSPNNHRVTYELGVLERVAGNIERSQELIRRTVELNPDHAAALRTYLSEVKVSYGDENYKRLQYAAARITEMPETEQIHTHYALAKACEDVGDLDSAFRHYGIAGEQKRKTDKYNEKESARMHQIIKKVVTKKNLDATNMRGSESEVPVFILGMPRSGTSLMEQILSSHPDVFGAGELKFLSGIVENIPVNQMRLRLSEKEPVFPYEQFANWAVRGDKFAEKLEKLAGRPYKRIVDKMPGNFNFVGIIHAILPKARIIHSRRHPVETCLSCYRIHFAEGHQWTYQLRELGRFYKRYWSLMEHWRSEFPGAMYEVRYEDNVADVEGSAKKLIAHLGLEWNENCLNFYNTDRPVKTASVTQVRKPIYTTSTNRWRKYEKYLGPLLEELGDIVPQYEAEIAHLTTSGA